MPATGAFAAGDEAANKFSDAVPAAQTEAAAETAQGSDRSEIHAYDPVAEQEKEKEYRDNVKYVEGRIVFSVLDIRRDEDKAVLLNDSSILCRENKLSNVEFLMDTAAENCECPYGYSGRQVFYSAAIQKDVWTTVDRLSGLDEVLTAEPDVLWDNSAEVGPVTVSAEEISKETHFASLDIENVWNEGSDEGKAPGDGVVVAVIDTGVDYNHPDLANNMWMNSGEIPGNYMDDDGNGYVDDIFGYNFVDSKGDPMDDHGHGTHVAGIIAMSPNGEGGVGIAYGAKIMAVKAGQASGIFASTDVAKAIGYAANNGADIINMSFGGTSRSYLVEKALGDAFTTCALIASAGNNSKTTTDAPDNFKSEDIYPAGYYYVIGVMATGETEELASFSNWDYLVGQNCEYEIAAPGQEIFSTLPGNRYARWSGTSMAAPCVSAAAAILRSKFSDKSKYSSRYIMGQIIGATESTAFKEHKLLDEPIVYPMLNITDSLTKAPTPKMILTECYIIDDPAVSDINNGDGIAQAGETIDLAFSAFNYWGVASDVQIELDAVSAGGVANPYIEVIEPIAHIPDIGTFATGNNGFRYNETGEMVGVNSPIRFRIKEDTSNDISLSFGFDVTYKNGMDKNDTSTYVLFPKPYCSLIVQHGRTLSGVIREDMTLTPDDYWIIENNLLIPKDVTVTVEPGTQIQFWSADPANFYADDALVFIQVEGRLICEGTEERPIEMFPGKGYECNGVVLTGRNSGRDWSSADMVDDDHTKGYTRLSYVNIINPGGIDSYLGAECSFNVTEIDHCRFTANIENLFFPTYIFAADIRDSVFDGFTVSGYYSSILGKNTTGCLFTNCSLGLNHKSTFTDNNVINMVFSNNVLLNCFSRDGEYLYKAMSTTFANNAILPDFEHYNVGNQRFVGSDARYDNEVYDLSGNYWGTSSIELAKKLCYDRDWNISLADINQEPILTLEDDMSDIYPFVAEAYFTDMTDTRLSEVNPGQKVRLHILFNRDMAQDILPAVSFGGAAPYTDYLLSGSWSSKREWQSEFTVDQFIAVGRMYLRIRDAAADSDKWKKTGTDAGRFFFEIEKSEAQSMALQGNGNNGAAVLTWFQDDYETFAGFNIYRGTSYDVSVPIIEQDFRKINNSLISGDECSYTDKEVTQGTDYYYYFTVMDTDLNESAPSNIICVTPRDMSAPEIVHIPITAFVPGEQLAVKARITDNVNVTAAQLCYKNTGSDRWATTPMRPLRDDYVSGNGDYRAVLSAYETNCSAIEYYITAQDGTNTGSIGSESDPFVMESVPEHRWDEGVITVEADCTHEGTITYTCIDCSAQRTEIIPREEHIHSAIRYKVMNSCTGDGIAESTCINCGEKFEIVLKATGHNYTDTIVSPTCHSQGYTEHCCENCGHYYRDSFVKPTEHNYTETIISKPGCLVDGVIQYTCADCGESSIRFISKTGHHFDTETAEPTCTRMGYTIHICRDCGYSYCDNYQPVKEHNYGIGEVIESPTVTSSGTMLYTCQDCGKTMTSIIPRITVLRNKSTINSVILSAGSKIRMKGAASGGTGNYRYAFYYKRSNARKWILFGAEFTEATEMSFTPTSVGEFNIKIIVKDDIGDTVERLFDMTVTDGITDAFVNESTVSASQAPPNTRIYMTAAAEGSEGYTYAFYYKRKTARAWTVVGQEFGEAETARFTPRSAGDFEIKIDIIDKYGNLSSKHFTLKII